MGTLQMSPQGQNDCSMLRFYEVYKHMAHTHISSQSRLYLSGGGRSRTSAPPSSVIFSLLKINVYEASRLNLFRCRVMLREILYC